MGSSGTITETLDNTTSTPQTVTYTFTTSANGCPVVMESVTVQVDPTPMFTNLPATENICSGDQLNFTPSSDVSGTVFTWTVSAPASINGETNGTGTIDDILINTSDAIQTVTYTLTATGPSPGSCVNSSTQTYMVTVNPNVVQTLTNNSPVVCEGVGVDIDYATPTENGAITLTATYPSGVSGSVGYTGQSIGSSGTITETLDNTTSTPQTVTYTFTTSANGCPVVVESTTVQVNPRPDVSAPGQTICSGKITSVALSNPNGVSGTIFSWVVVSSTNLSGAVSGTGSLIAQVLTTIDPSMSGEVDYQITPSAMGCPGTPINVTVQVTAQPVASAGADIHECDLDAVLNATLSTSGGSGTWTQVSGPGTITFDDNALINATATADQFGIYILQWEEDNNGCISTDELEVTFAEAPIVISVADDGSTLCEPDQINLSGLIGGGASNGSWSVQSGGTGTLSASSLTGSEVSATYFPVPGEFGPIVFRLTTDDSDGALGPCVVDFRDVNITVNESARVDAGPDFQICEDEIINLNGSFSGSTSTVTWSGGSGGTFGSTSNPVTTYTPSPADINAGEVILSLTTDDPDGSGPCTVIVDQITVTINELPEVALAGLNSVYAENDPMVNMQGFPSGGSYTGPGVNAGTNQFVPANANRAPIDNVIRYTYTDPETGCTNFNEVTVIVNAATNIDFSVAGAVEDFEGRPIVCAEQGLVRLFGNPSVSTGSPLTEFTSTPDIIDQVGGVYFLNTENLFADTVEVRYTYTNSALVTTQIVKDVVILATPLADISVVNSCIEDEIQFFDNSSIPGPGDAMIDSWAWDFGDTGTSSAQNPSHIYANPGEYTVSLTVTTDQGCSSTDTQDIIVGEVPVVDFVWSEICNGDATEFVDRSDAGESDIINYTWDFGDDPPISGPTGVSIPSGTHSDRTTGTFNAPFHRYENIGKYSVTLTIETNNGCINSFTQSVFILPFSTVLPSDDQAYFEDFEAGTGGWVPTANVGVSSDTSWLYGVATGSTITSPGSRVWWTGKNNGGYFPNEDSYVNGPCLDLSQLSRPMISMDIWVDTEAGDDGAVLQYSSNGGISWQNVGDLNGGIEWYNGEGILGGPGDRPGNFNEGDQGWTSPTDGWVSARFSLEQIPQSERDFVRFRIAFASNPDNSSGTDFNGFAFDNVFIGNKRRLVLLEHFTDNGSQVSLDANERLSNFAQEQLIDAAEIDFTTIQYHMDFTGTDDFNKDNPNDPSARVTFYGVSEPPVTVLDGSVINDLTFDIDEIDIDRRSLEDPIFDISIDNLAAPEDVVSVNVSVMANEDFSEQVVINAAVVEDNVVLNSVTFNNILKKLLFGGEGRTIDINWTPGSVQSQTAEWGIDIPIYEPENLFIVAFVQDKITREIYGAKIVKSPRKVAQQITSIPVDIAEQLKKVSVYPNPADEIINFKINESALERYSWKIVDQRGVTMLQGEMNFDSDGIFSVESRDLPNGVYYAILGIDDTAVIYRKLAIMNRQ
ncbi:MAG: PKD-like domain-containing protein [Bacteroidota bacterium]